MPASVLVTSPDLISAEKICSNLIEKKLAACANYFPSKTMYRWEGRIERNEEYIILLKIRSDDFPRVQKEVSRMHPYKVPCIVKYEIADGLPSYLQWIKESTDRPLED